MKPIINPFWIYFAEKCDILQMLLTDAGIAILLFALTAMVLWGSSVSKKIIIFGALMIFVGCLLPSKSDVLTMITFRYATTDNIELCGGSVEDTIDYITGSIDDILNNKN